MQKKISEEVEKFDAVSSSRSSSWETIVARGT